MREALPLVSFLLTALSLGLPAATEPQGKHAGNSDFPTYEGRVMCGYQGWFRAEGDGSGEGWSHYGERGPLTAATLHPDFWPDVAEYGGCSVMLGVPTYFRDLNVDTNPDPYLHQLIESADVVMPWMVQRFTPLVHLFDASRYEEQVRP